MKEKLSAFVDGELDAETTEAVMRSLGVAPDMRERWDAYCLIGDAMRGDAHGAQHLVSRVMAELDEEPTVLVPAAASEVRSKTFFGRSLMPVAASVMGVAAVGIVAFSMYPAGPAELEASPTFAEAEPTVTIAEVDSPAMSFASEALAPQREYLFVHQAMSGGPIPGVVHYVRTVSEPRGESH